MKNCKCTVRQVFKVIIFVLLIGISSCRNGSNNNSVESELVEVGDYDRFVESYIVDPIKLALSPSAITMDDLKTSSRLLLTPGGVLKGIEVSSDYHKVITYSCSPIGGGWYKVECTFMMNERETDWVCYIREKII